jgi:hypothetical protein
MKKLEDMLPLEEAVIINDYLQRRPRVISYIRHYAYRAMDYRSLPRRDASMKLL